MKILLREDVKNVGKVGDIVDVRSGYARNFLLPKKLAIEATDKRVKEWNHWQAVSNKKKLKMVEKRKEILKKMEDVTVTFKRQASTKADKIFGSVTTIDVATELEKLGYVVDRRDVVLEGPIKELGQFKALIRFGDNLETHIKVCVEREGSASE